MEKAYRIRGRVQGVGFRWWTRSQAVRLGLSGTVRNCPGGEVEVHAAGEPDALDRLEELLRGGPPGAEVKGVEEIVSTPVAGDEFRIVR